MASASVRRAAQGVSDRGDTARLCAAYLEAHKQSVRPEAWVAEASERQGAFTERLAESMYKDRKPASIDPDIACKMCGQNTCYRFQKQVRSADEGATAFIMCTRCNKRYKE